VHAALVGLGWPPREAEAALSVVADEYGSEADAMDVGVLLRTALRAMSGSVSTPSGR
jgi:Holliday junction resolvasome RuvABC DNA-binding subunit